MAQRRAGSGRNRPSPPSRPQHREADIPLRDGSAAHLRPIGPEDADALQDFHRSQSEQSRYLRFFAPMPELSGRDLERFTVVDHHDREALIVLQGDRIIAVGRYDRTSPHEAEVAFNVSDRAQGKGLGSVLLEHLIAAAREEGITTFTAEVLPQNHRMLAVFADAGFDVQRRYEDGVVEVSFDIDPTERSTAVRAEREHRAEAGAMERMLTPSSIVIVGVSSARDSVGGRFLAGLEASGYGGRIHVVTRDAFEVRGHRAHASIDEVPPPVDMAVLALRPADCLQAVDQCAKIGVTSLVVPTEGFADAGAEGAAAQRQLVTRARRHGMRLLGPAAFGFLRTGADAISVSLSPRLPRGGSTALAAQSSALAAMLLAGAESRGIGVHEFVGAGNRADVSINDCLQHWEDDPEARVVAMALESMGNPRKFTRIARRIARTRPVVVLRPPGLSAEAPPGHDVRVSSLPRAALDQVLSAAGVIGTRSVDELVDVVDVLDRQGPPAGARVGLLSNTPALGASLRGAADLAGLQVVADQRHVPAISDDRLMVRALTRMAAPGGVDMVILGMLDPLGGDLAPLASQLATIARGSGVGLVMCQVTEPDRFDALRRAVRADHDLAPVHPTPALAVRAAAGALAAATGLPGADEPPPERDGIDRARARTLVDQALAEQASTSAPRDGQGLLGLEAGRELLACYGLDLLDSRIVEDADQAVRAADKLGYPVVLKSTDPLLAHRADLGGVRLDIPDADQLRHAVARMREDIAYSDLPLLVQPMASPGVPVVVSSREDPSLGPVLSFSLAGDAADLLGDVAYAIPPITEQGARALIARPAASVRLSGSRGLPGADRAALADIIVRLGLLAEDIPEARLVELYPVIVGSDAASIVGAHIELRPAPNRTDAPRRALPGPSL